MKFFQYLLYMQQEDVIISDKDNWYLAKKFYLYVSGSLQFSLKRAAYHEIEE